MESCTYGTGVVSNGKVSSLATRLGWGGFPVWGRFAQVSGIQFVLKGLVSGLGEHRFFFQDGQDTHRLKIAFRQELELDVSIGMSGVF